MNFLSGFLARNFIQHIKVKQTAANDLNCFSQILFRNHEGRGEPNPILKSVRKQQRGRMIYLHIHMCRFRQQTPASQQQTELPRRSSLYALFLVQHDSIQ